MNDIWTQVKRDWEEDFPRCPVCGEETDALYQDGMGDIVGCEKCLERIDAWEIRRKGR